MNPALRIVDELNEDGSNALVVECPRILVKATNNRENL